MFLLTKLSEAEVKQLVFVRDIPHTMDVDISALSQLLRT